MSDNLHLAAYRCLVCSDLETKLQLATALPADLAAGQLCPGPPADLPATRVAGRPLRPPLVAPTVLPRRRIGTPEGQAALLHAVAHIEFNAINLACDAAYRFLGLPLEYYADWLQIAAEEAYHFSLVQARLHELGYGYGDFPAHDGLWELAVKTADDPLQRMALVPRVMEARGLDVTPGMIARFRNIGDLATAAVLEIILRDEIGHVAAGTRWFQYLCDERGLEPESTYFSLLQQHLRNGIACPLNTEARRQAGFTANELTRLEGLCKKS